MNQRILAFLLALCLLLSPVSVCALSEGVDDAVVAAAADTQALPPDGAAAVPQWAVTYDPKQQKTPDDLPAIACKAAYVADPDSGKVFFEKNAHEKMYPASTTKVLTALLVLENCDPDDIVTVSQHAIDLKPVGYSSANLKAGEKLSVYTLLQALLIPSANEAAYALAEHVSGSVESFAALSNKRAKELGCESLHFVNPNGVHDDNHYCSAYDLYLIARECRKYDVSMRL